MTQATETFKCYRVWVDRCRRDFPILNRPLPGKGGAPPVPLAYLDNAATTQKPESVIRAVAQYYITSNANVHGGVHSLAERATEAYESSRKAVAEFLGCTETHRIVFTRSATEAINLVASSFSALRIGRGDEFLLTEMEHHSNLVPWQLAARARGARLRFIPFGGDGTLELDRLDKLLTDRTKIVSVVHVSNVLGTINDVRTIIRAAHAAGIPVLLDAAQSAPHIPVDVKALDCDFLVFSGHKIYGPTGIGVLYAKEEYLEAMPPYQSGGKMIESVWLDRAKWNRIPYKFEAGTPNVAGAVGLKAALRYVTEAGRERIAAYETALTRYAVERLQQIPGVDVYGNPPDRSGIVPFNLRGIHPHDAAQFLDTKGIAVRAGHHCAYPTMRKLGVPATLRVSFSFYNTPEEVDRLVEALSEAREFFGRDS